LIKILDLAKSVIDHDRITFAKAATCSIKPRNSVYY